MLSLLGYTEYTGFSLRFPSNSASFSSPSPFKVLPVCAELALATAEVAALVAPNRNGNVHNLNTLMVLQEAEAFPGNDPEGW